MQNTLPRMLGWALLTVALIVAALFAQHAFPGTVFSVTLYKAHLMALGGWGGYWLDRALFPYDRPHEYLQHTGEPEEQIDGMITGELVAYQSFGLSMLRRAIIVAACLLCVGLGA